MCFCVSKTHEKISMKKKSGFICVVEWEEFITCKALKDKKSKSNMERWTLLIDIKSISFSSSAERFLPEFDMIWDAKEVVVYLGELLASDVSGCDDADDRVGGELSRSLIAL